MTVPFLFQLIMTVGGVVGAVGTAMLILGSVTSMFVAADHPALRPEPADGPVRGADSDPGPAGVPLGGTARRRTAAATAGPNRYRFDQQPPAGLVAR